MLKRVGSVLIPSSGAGGFDHADVHRASGKVYIAHTANDCLEVVDGVALKRIVTIPGCPEASGVLCAQDEGLVFAAARGAGKVLVVDSSSDRTIGEVKAGFRPNGLAWDATRKRLLVADVEDNKARLVDPRSGKGLGELALRGRPRWSLYERSMDSFLVNIKEPSGIVVIRSDSFVEQKFLPVSAQGPHGLEIVEGAGRAFVACDGGVLIAVNLMNGMELGTVALSGVPDVVWMNPERNRIYCAIGRPGVIDVIDSEKLVVTERLVTEEAAHTLTFDVVRQRLYALLPGSQCAAVYTED